MNPIYLMLALVLLYYAFNHYSTTTRCWVCGEIGDRHKQDCPRDFGNREEKS